MCTCTHRIFGAIPELSPLSLRQSHILEAIFNIASFIKSAAEPCITELIACRSACLRSPLSDESILSKYLKSIEQGL